MIFILEGNVGAGKSTLLEPIRLYLESAVGPDRVVVIREPVDEWCGRYNLVERFYRNPAEDGLQFQITALLDVLENERTAVRASRQGKYVVMERSLFSTVRVFCEMFSWSREISEEDKSILKLLCGRYKPQIATDAGYARFYRLYVRTPVTVCLSRVNERSRGGEDRISVDYLNSLERITEMALTEDGIEAKRVVSVDGAFSVESPLSTAVQDVYGRPLFPKSVTSTLQDFLATVLLKED